MDHTLVVLRTFHIVPAVFWTGSALFQSFVLEPALRRMGSEIEHAVMRSVNRVLSPAIMGASALTIVFGFILIGTTPDHGFAELFRDGWGLSIGIGMVATILAAIAGGIAGFMSARLRQLLDRVDRGGVRSEDYSMIDVLSSRVRTYNQVQALLLLVAVGTMAGARFV